MAVAGGDKAGLIASQQAAQGIEHRPPRRTSPRQGRPGGWRGGGIISPPSPVGSAVGSPSDQGSPVRETRRALAEGAELTSTGAEMTKPGSELTRPGGEVADSPASKVRRRYVLEVRLEQRLKP